MKTFPPPPRIAPLPETGFRTRWSVMIPTYNRTTFLERTLESVLSQDPGPEEMQIEVVDDASTLDDPESLVRRVGGGRVSFFRQSRHLATSANYNSCIERSVGEWVQILNSDDVVFTGFYKRFKTALENRNDVGAAFCRHAYVDEAEVWHGTSEPERPTPEIIPEFLDRIGVAQTVSTPSVMVVRRKVYEDLGGFRPDLPCAADWEMWIRIAARYPFWYEPAILAAWREHSQQSLATFTRLARDISDMRRCLEMSRPLFPPDRAESMSLKANELLSLAAFDNAYSAAARMELRAAIRQAGEGLRCSASPRAIQALLWLPFRIAGGMVRRSYRVVRER